MSINEKRRPGARSQAAQQVQQDVLADDIFIVPDAIEDDLFDHEAWVVEVRDTILQFAATGQVFDSGDVRALGVTDAAHPHHWGQVYARLHAEGWIEPDGWRSSPRKTMRGSGVRTWRGTRKAQRARQGGEAA